MLYKGTLVRTSGSSEYVFSDFVVPIDSEWAFALFLSKVGQISFYAKCLFTTITSASGPQCRKFHSRYIEAGYA